LNKRHSQRKHAKQRFQERFGIDLSPAKRLEIVGRIRNRKATFILHQTNRVSLWDIDMDHQVIRVAFDRNRQEIITAMWPFAVPEWVDCLDVPLFSDVLEEINYQLHWNGSVCVRCTPARKNRHV
jgi:isopentenyldiphosphate isomerase